LPYFDVYGQDHSPWVQAVLLGLFEKGDQHTLTTIPPLSLFRSSGILMPAASIDGGEWQLESTEILQRAGFSPVSGDDLLAIYDAWQGVQHRTDRTFRFWHRFSLCRDPHVSTVIRLRNHFFRSFATLYFYLLIRLMVLIRNQEDPENFGDQFLFWEDRLEKSSGEYIDGKSPDTLDLLLFGILQCHCSIPVPPIEALQKDPRLTRMRAWISTMNARFVAYDYLYSGVYFDPYSPAPTPTTPIEQAAFWLGSIFMVAFIPITGPLIVFFASRIERAPKSG
jgi:hypothetical protein